MTRTRRPTPLPKRRQPPEGLSRIAWVYNYDAAASGHCALVYTRGFASGRILAVLHRAMIAFLRDTLTTSYLLVDLA